MPRKRGVARYLRDTYKAGRLAALRQSPRSGSAATKVEREGEEPGRKTSRELRNWAV